MTKLQKFIERLVKSSVLWKQVLITAFGVIWLTLRATGVVQASSEEQVLNMVVVAFDAILALANAIYGLYSGGNNADSTEEY